MWSQGKSHHTYQDLPAMIIERYNLEVTRTTTQFNGFSVPVLLLFAIWIKFPPSPNLGTMIAASIIVCVLSVLTSHTPISLLLSNSWSIWSNGKSSRTVFSHPSCQWVLLWLIADRRRSGTKLIFRIHREAQQIPTVTDCQMLWQRQSLPWKKTGQKHQGWTAFGAYPKQVVSWGYYTWAVVHVHVVQHARGRKWTEYWNTQKTLSSMEKTCSRTRFRGGTNT